MKVLLIIAVLIDGAPVIKQVFPIQDAKCEYVRDHPVVRGSWKEIFGKNTVFYCVED